MIYNHISVFKSGTSLLAPNTFRDTHAVCYLHLKGTLNTDHILGSETTFGT